MCSQSPSSPSAGSELPVPSPGGHSHPSGPAACLAPSLLPAAWEELCVQMPLTEHVDSTHPGTIGQDGEQPPSLPAPSQREQLLAPTPSLLPVPMLLGREQMRRKAGRRPHTWGGSRARCGLTPSPGADSQAEAAKHDLTPQQWLCSRPLRSSSRPTARTEGSRPQPTPCRAHLQHLPVELGERGARLRQTRGSHSNLPAASCCRQLLAPGALPVGCCWGGSHQLERVGGGDQRAAPGPSTPPPGQARGLEAWLSFVGLP